MAVPDCHRHAVRKQRSGDGLIESDLIGVSLPARGPVPQARADNYHL